jgi:hypothetical protein
VGTRGAYRADDLLERFDVPVAEDRETISPLRPKAPWSEPSVTTRQVRPRRSVTCSRSRASVVPPTTEWMALASVLRSTSTVSISIPNLSAFMIVLLLVVIGFASFGLCPVAKTHMRLVSWNCKSESMGFLFNSHELQIVFMDLRHLLSRNRRGRTRALAIPSEWGSTGSCGVFTGWLWWRGGQAASGPNGTCVRRGRSAESRECAGSRGGASIATAAARPCY